MRFKDGEPFEPFTDTVPYDLPLKRLQELQERARHILHGRTQHELQEATRDTAFLKANYFYITKEQWIIEQLEQGTSILRFLPYERRTVGGLHELIDESDAYPEIAAELDLPMESNTNELDALEASLEDVDLDDDGFPNGTIEEYVAVLALNQIARAMDLLVDLDSSPHTTKDYIRRIQLYDIANEAVSIMETVCRAESLRNQRMLEHELESRMDQAIPKKADELARKKISLAAAKAARTRHEPTGAQKAALLAEWDATACEYRSRADFARIISSRDGIKYRTLYDWIAEHDKAKT